MDFKNRVKGKVTQTLVEALLEDVEYRIVPLGIEEVVREVSCLSQAEYSQLGLPNTLKKLPDFFIAKKDLSKTWLVEVKYRDQWNDQVRDELGAQLYDQIKLWSPVYLVLFVNQAVRQNKTPASHLAVGKLIIRNDELGILRKTYLRNTLLGTSTETFIPWDEITWDKFARFQDVFDDVTDRWEAATISRTIEIMRSLAADTV